MGTKRHQAGGGEPWVPRGTKQAEGSHGYQEAPSRGRGVTGTKRHQAGGGPPWVPRGTKQGESHLGYQEAPSRRRATLGGVAEKKTSALTY